MNANLIKSIGQAVAEEQARLRWLIMSVVGGAIRLSETETMAATANLTGIQHEAKQHVGDLKVIVERFGGERQLAAQVIGHQSKFCDEATLRLRKQSEDAERAIQLTQEISGFVGMIGKISNAVRVLTINGYIESTRLGGEGQTFAVIAEQLRELSDQVRSANEGIRDLTANLTNLIPVIADNTRILLRLTEDFAQEHVSHVSAFQNTYDASQHELNTSLHETRERAQRILSRTDRILSHLQYQDRMTQNLRDIEDIASHTEKIMRAMFERLAGESEGDVAGALGDARSAMPTRSRSRLGQAAEETTSGLPKSGEVMLFE